MGSTCGITVFIGGGGGGALGGLFSFPIFAQDFRDFGGSYLWNGDRYWLAVKGLPLSFRHVNTLVIKPSE